MDAQKASHFRWVVIGLLFFITVVNYIDRASISYAIDDMAALFHLNDTQQGWILGGFGIGYIVTTFLSGIAVDRYGPKHMMAYAVILWALAIFFTGLAMGFMMAFISRIVLGLAEGPNFPAMTRAVGDWLPKEERATALSYSLIAVPIALAIGGPMVSQLVVHFEWRGMFFILSIVALIWLPFWWWLFENFPEKSQRVNMAELQVIHDGQASPEFDDKQIRQRRQNIKSLWRYLLTNPTLLANYWAFFVFGYFLFFFMTWLPSFLADEYQMKLTHIGLFTVLPWTFAALMMWLVGYLSDYILRKTGNYRLARSYPIWLSQLLAALCVIPVAFIHDIDITLLFISLAVGFSMSANATFYATNIDVAKERAGTALGIMDAAFALAGFVAPVVTGWTVTLTHSFVTAFVLLSVLALSSVIIVFIFHRPQWEQSLERYTHLT